jgi:hypothetical protein
MFMDPALTGGIKKVSSNNNSPIILLGLPQNPIFNVRPDRIPGAGTGTRIKRR